MDTTPSPTTWVGILKHDVDEDGGQCATEACHGQYDAFAGSSHRPIGKIGRHADEEAWQDGNQRVLEQRYGGQREA